MTDSHPDVFAAVDVHYLCSGGARAAAVTARDPAFAAIQAEWTVPVPTVLPYQPGQFFHNDSHAALQVRRHFAADLAAGATLIGI